MSARERVAELAARIAVSVDVADRIATDPSYSADRSAAATRARTERLAQLLADYRAACAEIERTPLDSNAQPDTLYSGGGRLSPVSGR